MSSSFSEPLHTARNTPAAEGKVEVQKTDQGNMKLLVKVEHLAPPDKVVAGTTTYVVWAQPAYGGAPQNLGGMMVGDDLTGSLNTKTAAGNMKITVTPEKLVQIEKPTNPPVLWATVESRQ